MAVEQVAADFPKNPPPIRERILTDLDFALLLKNADAYLEKTVQPKPTLQEKILQDPDFYLLLQNADKFLATPEPPTAPIQVLEPITAMPAITEPVPPAPPIENIQTIQSRLSALKTKLSKVPVSDTAMWQRLSNQISLLANQEVQMLGKVAKNAALAARWHWEGVKDFVPDISRKKAALTAAGFGTVGALAGAAYPISTRAAQAFSTTRAAIVQPAALPAYGITEEADTSETQQQAKPVTSGTLLTENPIFFRPGSREPVEFTPGSKELTVLRPAGDYKFLVQTPAGEMEIPMNQLDVQGKFSWEKEVKPVKWLGFEFPSAQDMYKMTELGAGFVRIPIEQADQKFFKENPEVIPAIKAAKDRNLEILLLFNPTQTLSLPELKNRIDGILNLAGNYPKVVFELGNEPDLDTFWERGDLDSYAEFVKAASSYLWQKQPSAKIVIAATSQREKIQPLINKLKQHGVDLGKFTFSVHAYNDPNEVTKRADLVKAMLGPNAQFIFDELGVNISDSAKDKLIIQMINNARASGAQRVGIFQLYNVQFVDGNGLWGYIDPDGKWLPPAKRLMNLAWEQTHQ